MAHKPRHRFMLRCRPGSLRRSASSYSSTRPCAPAGPSNSVCIKPDHKSGATLRRSMRHVTADYVADSSNRAPCKQRRRVRSLSPLQDIAFERCQLRFVSGQSVKVEGPNRQCAGNAPAMWQMLCALLDSALEPAFIRPYDTLRFHLHLHNLRRRSDLAAVHGSLPKGNAASSPVIGPPQVRGPPVQAPSAPYLAGDTFALAPSRTIAHMQLV